MSLQQYFPNALKGSEFTEKAVKYLSERGFKPENTLFGHSTCSDEACRTVTNFGKHYGENFILAGLAGLPFVGDAGFAAFAHHVPDNGKLLVLYGPHIAINADGEIGKLRRPGQGHDSTACGAAFGVLKWLDSYQGDGTELSLEDPKDHQINYIKKLFLKNKERIQSSPSPGIEATMVLCEDIDKLVGEIVDNYLSEAQGEIALIGGIMIHGPNESYFQPRRMEIRKNSQIESFLEEIIKK